MKFNICFILCCISTSLPVILCGDEEVLSRNKVENVVAARNLNLVVFKINGATDQVVFWIGNLRHTTNWQEPVPGINIVDYWRKWDMHDVIEVHLNTKAMKEPHVLNRLIDGNSYKFRMAPFAEKERTDTIGFIVDITDLQSKSSQVDREFTNFKLSLFGILNHNVRHPLYDLTNDLQNMKDDLPLLTKCRRKDFVKENGGVVAFETVYKNMEHYVMQIEHHVANILRTHRIVETFLALQEKQLSLVSQTFDVIDLVMRLYDQYYALAKTKAIEYELVIEPAENNISPVLKHDSDKIAFCISALIENAIKHAPINGVITFYVTVAHDYLKFLVVDNGPGIPANRLSNVLQRIKHGDDFKIDNPDTGSLGLSLMVVNRIVETLMNGKFTISNHHGANTSSGSVSTLNSQGSFCYFKGSTLAENEIISREKTHKERLPANKHDSQGFSAHISIPIKRDVVTSYRSHELSERFKQQHSRKKEELLKDDRVAILIVDDDPQAIKVLQRMLAKTGHLIVYTADDGLSGSVEYQRHHREIRLVITDIQMTHCSGYDLAKKIRAYENSLRLISVPIIAISAGGSGDIRKKCIDAGCVEYLTKPLSLNHLDEMIQRYAL